MLRRAVQQVAGRLQSQARGGLGSGWSLAGFGGGGFAAHSSSETRCGGGGALLAAVAQQLPYRGGLGRAYSSDSDSTSGESGGGDDGSSNTSVVVSGEGGGGGGSKTTSVTTWKNAADTLFVKKPDTFVARRRKWRSEMHDARVEWMREISVAEEKKKEVARVAYEEIQVGKKQRKIFKEIRVAATAVRVAAEEAGPHGLIITTPVPHFLSSALNFSRRGCV